jgi:hypothetical protein
MRTVITALVLVGFLAFHSAQNSAPAHAEARDLSFSQVCANGKSNVTFKWAGTASNGLQIWLDLTIFDNRWQPGSYIGAGPIDGAATSFTWDGLTADTMHYVRVNQQLADGRWDPSRTYSFSTRCGPSNTVPAATPGNSFRVLGFSDSGPVGNRAPDGLVANGGTLSTCSATTIYVYLTISSAQAKEVAVVWYVNGGVFSEAHDLIPLKAGANAYVLSIFNQATTPTRESSGNNVYSFKMTSGGNNVEAEGNVTVAC